MDSLLTWIHDGEIAIPEIQRPFVWKESQVRDLIDSLYKGFPVGYIITWRSPDVKLKDGSRSLGKKILIDGQQRITALQAAVAGYPIIDKNYRRKRIQIAFNPIEEKFEVRNAAINKDSRWIPDISVVYNNFNAYSFVREYCNKNGIQSPDSQDHLNDILMKLRGIENSNLGVIELSHQLNIDDVTNIFIRINSKGMVLSQADFAMSKISADEQYGGNVIRKVVDYFCRLVQCPEDVRKIEENDTEFAQSDAFAKIKWIVNEKEDIYRPDYNDMLRVAFTFKFLRGRLNDLVSLLSGRDFATRDYKEEIAQQSFALLKEGVMAFVSQTNFQRFLMILKSAGIIEGSLVGSKNLLSFGYALYLLLREQKEDPAVIEKVIRKWVILTILTGRYSGSPESQFDFDIKHFQSDGAMAYLQQVERSELSQGFWENGLITRLNTPVSSNPAFKVFLMAQVKTHDCGFLSEQITVQSLMEQRGDIHHIFPKKYLQKHGLSSKQYNQVANYVYTQTEINIKISDDAPFQYMGEVRKQCESGEIGYGGIHSMDDLKKNMKQNCIPEEIFDMDYHDYDDFLALRRKLMAEKMHQFYDSLA